MSALNNENKGVFDEDNEDFGKWVEDEEKRQNEVAKLTEQRDLDKFKVRLARVKLFQADLAAAIDASKATVRKKLYFVEMLERAHQNAVSSVHAASSSEEVAIKNPVAYPEFIEKDNPNFCEKILSHAIGRDYIDRYFMKKCGEINESAAKEINELVVASQEKIQFWAKAVKLIQEIDLLGYECPNFGRVIEKVKESLILSRFEESDRPKPILMVSPPGCGKTYFIQRLAEYLHLPFVDFDLSALDSAFSITGSSSAFQKASYSKLTRAVAEWNADSGILFFDEFTAIMSDDTKTYPVKPSLLSILDVDQSKRFKDIFFDVNIDISRWFKFAACNDLSGLTSAMLDRFDVIQIKPPSFEERVKIVSSIAAKTSFDFKEDFFEHLAVASGSSRTLRDLVRQACINAARRGSNQVQDLDIKRLGIKRSI